MSRATTPLFATACLGATISHVHVFSTHITYQQTLGPDIWVPSDMIASVEERVYENEFVILRTTGRRRIICMVQPNRAAALCAAIRDAHTTNFPAKEIKNLVARENPSRTSPKGWLRHP